MNPLNAHGPKLGRAVPALVAAVVTGAAALPASAQETPPAGLIYGCYVSNGSNPSGNLSLRLAAWTTTNLKESCTGQETAFVWNATGPQGPQGLHGPQGATGLTGATGPQGLKGDKGDTGEQGIQGEKGEKGDKGDTGDQGPQGIQGIQGTQGIQGEKGDQGDKGDPGEQGPQGIQGEKGEKGDKGDTGEQGIQGEKGDTGDQGPQGIQGEVGPQGPQGIQGPQGPTGLSGWQRVEGFGATAQQGQVTRLVVACPAGKSVLGGGYENPDSRGTANTVLASFPASQTTWEVHIFNPSGATSFSVKPYAICATVTP